MSSPASSKRKRKSGSAPQRRGRALVAFVLAVIMLPGMVWGAEEEYLASIMSGLRSNPTRDAIVLPLAHTGNSGAADHVVSLAEDATVHLARGETCPVESTAALSLVELPLPAAELLRFIITPQANNNLSVPIGDALSHANTKGVDLLSFARKKMLPKFATTYRALLKRVAMLGLPRVESTASLSSATIIGTISTYNPYREGREEGGPQTASGEPYDPTAWTAAIKTELRNNFGGVRYGRLYQPAFALVQSGAKQLIVKINDVGPLRPGRVLDLNERSMRHFDPFLRDGLIKDAKITLLPGDDWTPGPVGTAYAIDFARDEQRPLVVEFGPTDATASLDSEMARWHAPVGHAPYSMGRGDIRAEPARAKAARL